MLKHKQLSDFVFSVARGVQAEVLIESSESALTRFAGNVISQNVFSSSTEMGIRLFRNGRNVRLSASVSDKKNLKRKIEEGLSLLEKRRVKSSLPPMLKGGGAAKRFRAYFPDTAGLTPEFRASAVKKAVDRCKRKKAECYGTFENGESLLTVANNRGIFKSFRESFCDFQITVRSGNGMGWAGKSSRNINDMDFSGIVSRAIEKAEKSAGASAAGPGKYDVILEPAAAAELISMLAFYGFSSKALAEGRSFASGKMGEKVFGNNINIIDDAISGPSAGMPFDFEGAPKKRLVLVENGRIRDFPMDRESAEKLGLKPTGHSLPVPNSSGAVPLNIYMPAGNKKVEEMIAETGKGLLITQFHYTNMIRPEKLEMTGMTRNGTFLIENGRIKKAVKNLRFTESIITAFNNMESAGDSLETFSDYGALVSAPAMKIRNFNFSSGTGF